MKKYRPKSRPTKLLVELAQERILGCEQCSKGKAFDFAGSILGPLRLKKREGARLLRALTCPNCEAHVGSDALVAVPTQEQMVQWRQSKKFESLYAKRVAEFRFHLVRFPALALNHSFGQLLARAVRRTRLTTLQPRTWYRAVRNLDNPQFGPRPQDRAGRAYRFNQIGQIAWYLGTDQKTAAVEVLRSPQQATPFAISEIEILQPVSVLDLRVKLWGDESTFHWTLRNVINRGLISQPTDDVDESRPQYRLPQFIADLAREKGARGILYNSSRPSAYNNPEAVGDNLILFDPIPSNRIGVPIELEFFGPDYDPFGLETWKLKPHRQRATESQEQANHSRVAG